MNRKYVVFHFNYDPVEDFAFCLDTSALNVLKIFSNLSSVAMTAGESLSSSDGFSSNQRAAPKWSNSGTAAGINLNNASAFFTMRWVGFAPIRLAAVTTFAGGGLYAPLS